MFLISDIKAEAKVAFQAQRKTAIFIMLVNIGIGILIGFIDLARGELFLPLRWVVWLFLSFVSHAMAVNTVGEHNKIARGESGQVSALFSLSGFWRKSLTMWLTNLLIGLWTLLLIVPGIIKTHAYWFTYNLLADYPHVKGLAAIDLSKRMTQGYKMKIFLFHLSFIGWLLLSVFTLGILWVVFVGPYTQLANAKLYLLCKERALEEGVITLDELEGY